MSWTTAKHLGLPLLLLLLLSNGCDRKESLTATSSSIDLLQSGARDWSQNSCDVRTSGSDGKEIQLYGGSLNPHASACATRSVALDIDDTREITVTADVNFTGPTGGEVFLTTTAISGTKRDPEIDVRGNQTAKYQLAGDGWHTLTTTLRVDPAAKEIRIWVGVYGPPQPTEAKWDLTVRSASLQFLRPN